MSIHHANPQPKTQYALVLTQGGEPDLVGIWGPYLDESAATQAMNELMQWPIDGAWEVVAMKKYPVTAAPVTLIRGGTSGQFFRTADA